VASAVSLRKKPPDRPLRDGANDSHSLYEGKTAYGPIAVFLDNGTGASYIDEGAVRIGHAYESRKPVKLRGVGGGKGPAISEDIVVERGLRQKDGN